MGTDKPTGFGLGLGLQHTGPATDISDVDHLATLTELGQNRRGLGMLPPVHSVYQPIVDLSSGETIAFEALARGPRGTEWELPEALFADARRHGVVAALDWECRAAAMSGALRRRLPASVPLFVNAEAPWLDVPPPPHLEGVVSQGTDRLQLVVEITEGDLVNDPAVLVATLERLREQGWGIAVDDVGADPACLALLPLLEPDVIKIDLGLVRDHPAARLDAVAHAVTAEAERSGAIVLAEGIETDPQLQQSLAMGATHGQGWLLGRPGPLPAEPRPVPHDLSFTRPCPDRTATPFALVAGGNQTRIARKAELLRLSRQLEEQAVGAPAMPVLLSCFETADRFTPATAARYERLSAHCAFIGVVGAGMAPAPRPGVRGGRLAAGDPLTGEWVVSVLGPDAAGALIAKDLGDDGPDEDRRFELVVSHDRGVVIAASRCLLARIAAP